MEEDIWILCVFRRNFLSECYISDYFFLFIKCCEVKCRKWSNSISMTKISVRINITYWFSRKYWDYYSSRKNNLSAISKASVFCTGMTIRIWNPKSAVFLINNPQFQCGFFLRSQNPESSVIFQWRFKIFHCIIRRQILLNFDFLVTSVLGTLPWSTGRILFRLLIIRILPRPYKFEKMLIWSYIFYHSNTNFVYRFSFAVSAIQGKFFLF